MWSPPVCGTNGAAGAMPPAMASTFDLSNSLPCFALKAAAALSAACIIAAFFAGFVSAFAFWYAAVTALPSLYMPGPGRVTLKSSAENFGAGAAVFLAAVFFAVVFFAAVFFAATSPGFLYRDAVASFIPSCETPALDRAFCAWTILSRLA